VPLASRPTSFTGRGGLRLKNQPGTYLFGIPKSFNFAQRSSCCFDLEWLFFGFFEELGDMKLIISGIAAQKTAKRRST